MTSIDAVEPREVFHFFAALSAIPRGSGNERQVSGWLKAFADERGLEVHQDEHLNILIRKPATAGYENAQTVILHGHMDMVCEKVEGSRHDFFIDPIRLIVDEASVTADGTSLGADNGVGVSYILALLDSDTLAHPALEAVLTVMEEKGKVGAANFDASQLRGTRMIDFNWITDDEILAGCGGDLTLKVDLPRDDQPTPADLAAAEIAIRGLRGGHCEFDIHLERANAIVTLARVVDEVRREVPELLLTAVDGGAQNNVIPSEATARVVFPTHQQSLVHEAAARIEAVLQTEYASADPELRVEVAGADLPDYVQSAATTDRLLSFISLCPDGVESWSLVTPGIVESANNLGTVRTEENRFEFMTTITAGVSSRKYEIERRLGALAALVGGTAARYGLDAPEFPYNPESLLLAIAHRAHTEVTGNEARTLVSNCSLELGMFTQRIPGLDTISIGTNLTGLHSPAERLSHASVRKTWPVVKELLAQLNS